MKRDRALLGLFTFYGKREPMKTQTPFAFSPQLLQIFHDLNYPINKAKILDRAREQKLPVDALKMLNLISDRSYQHEDQLLQELESSTQNPNSVLRAHMNSQNLRHDDPAGRDSGAGIDRQKDTDNAVGAEFIDLPNPGAEFRHDGYKEGVPE